jgi:hypothetical protein
MPVKETHAKPTDPEKVFSDLRSSALISGKQDFGFSVPQCLRVSVVGFIEI